MIVLLGIAGSGKSTQRALLAEKLGCPAISTGDILREKATGQARIDLDAGRIVDDEITLDLLWTELSRMHVDRDEFILDGSPRSINQAHWLVDKIKNKQIKFTAVVHLKLSKATAKERLLARGRHDDVDGAIEERFRVQYEEVIVPVLSYIREQGLAVYDVDADKSIEEVQKEIYDTLEPHLK